MDLPRLLDLLRTSSLYLASLPTMEDEWEGAVAPESDPFISILHMLNTFGGTVEEAQHFIATMERSDTERRSCVFINCWHQSEVESAAMWKLYEPTGRGIAIQTSVASLCESITDEKETLLAKVEYVDFERPDLEMFNYLRKYSYKRESFKHEQELRLLHFDLTPSRPMNALELARNPPKEQQGPGTDYENIIDYSLLPSGKHLNVDVKTLIQSVVVAPDAPAWFIDVVRDVMQRYGYSVPVQASAMLARPRYGHH